MSSNLAADLDLAGNSHIVVGMVRKNSNNFSQHDLCTSEVTFFQALAVFKVPNFLLKQGVTFWRSNSRL